MDYCDANPLLRATQSTKIPPSAREKKNSEWGQVNNRKECGYRFVSPGQLA